MESPGSHELVLRSPVCSRCGAVMGVYEPLACVVDGRLVRSSRAADPELLGRAEVCFHAGCFEHRIVSAVDAA